MDSDDSGSTEPEIRHGSSSLANDSLTCENAQFEDDKTKTPVSNDDYGSMSVNILLILIVNNSNILLILILSDQ